MPSSSASPTRAAAARPTCRSPSPSRALEDPRWEPLFDLLEQSGIVLSFHVTVFPKAGDAFDKYKGSPGATFLHAKMFIEQFLDPFVDLFAWGILERHPKLQDRHRRERRRLGAVGGRGARLPPLAAVGVQGVLGRQGRHPPHKKPSEVFQRQVYGTFQQSPTCDVALRSSAMAETCCGQRTTRTPTRSGPTPVTRSSGRCDTCRRRCAAS